MGWCGREGGCWGKFRDEAELMPFPGRDDCGRGC